MPTSEPHRPVVCVVDDDAAVRDALCLLLQLSGYRPAGFASAEQFLLDPRLGLAACLILDLRLPGIDGERLHEQLRQRGVLPPVVVVTAHGDVNSARRALRGGAVDFIEKPIDDDELLRAVGEAVRSHGMRQAHAATEAALERLERLTEREREIFDRVTVGLHNREIAAEFGISPRTVEVHRARVMEKLGLRRAADLFRVRFRLDEQQG